MWLASIANAKLLIMNVVGTNPNEIYCRRSHCRCLLGKIIFEGQAFEMGNVRLWIESPLTCSQCDKPFRFMPKPIDNDLFSLETLEKDYNF
jgi:hypothetical protein